MALVAYTPERRAIKARGQALGEVQGLSLEHVSSLLRQHLPDLEALIDLFSGEKMANAFAAEQWMDMALPMITQAPGLVANIIALAANEPTAAPKVQTWPISVQIAALVVIFDLSFTEIGEVKKAVGLVATLQTALKMKKGNTKPLKKR